MGIAEAEGAMISPTRFCHFVLRTSPANYQAMVDWWLAFLGGAAIWRNDRLCFISYDDEHHRLAIFHDGDLPRNDEAPTRGLAHVAFAYDTLEQLLTTYILRKKAQVKSSWAVNHGPATSIYYLDPDGNEVETQVDNFATSEEATAFMCGPDFGENPIGVDFVPEDLIKRLESGESEAVLKRRLKSGPRH